MEKDLKVAPPEEQWREEGDLCLKKSRDMGVMDVFEGCHVGAGCSIFSVVLEVKRRG